MAEQLWGSLTDGSGLVSSSVVSEEWKELEKEFWGTTRISCAQNLPQTGDNSCLIHLMNLIPHQVNQLFAHD